MHIAASLQDRSILIVEDDYLIAQDLDDVVTAAGGRVVGPYAQVGCALGAIMRDTPLDAAILDVNLGRGTTSYVIASHLAARGVPFLFATGKGQEEVTHPFRDRPHCCKPMTRRRLLAAIENLLPR